MKDYSVIRKFRITAADGKKCQTQFYNLDAIISVGYRVNSKRATQFRQWATQVLREFAIKGYVLDNKRLVNGSFLNEDYFALIHIEQAWEDNRFTAEGNLLHERVDSGVSEQRHNIRSERGVLLESRQYRIK